MALEAKPMKQAARKISLKKASAGEIIAGLKIVPAEERRAMAALASAKRILAKRRAIVAKPSATVKLRSSCK
ncbi:MAG: hypothetical protein AB7F94_18675 [Nitrospira sp.]